LAALERWVANRCQAGKVERIEPPRVDSAEVIAEVSRANLRKRGGVTYRPAPVHAVGTRPRQQVRAAMRCVLQKREETSLRLKTADPKAARPRMRLLLWHALRKGELLGDEKHEAWIEYGGRIAPAVQRLLRRLRKLPWEKYELEREAAAEQLGYHPRTIDWLTDHVEARGQDPVRQAVARRLARSRARNAVGKERKLTPISKSWQFYAVTGMLVRMSGGRAFYALTIRGVTLKWSHPVENQTEVEALVEPAVEARKQVNKAASTGGSVRKGHPTLRAH